MSRSTSKEWYQNPVLLGVIFVIVLMLWKGGPECQRLQAAGDWVEHCKLLGHVE